MSFSQSDSAAPKSSCCSASSARSVYSSALLGVEVISRDKAARVSLGGLRMGTCPLGSSTLRKKTDSNRPEPSTFSAHLESSACRPRAPTAPTQAMIALLRAYFNVHLPAADVMREILGCTGELVAPSAARGW